MRTLCIMAAGFCVLFAQFAFAATEQPTAPKPSGTLTLKGEMMYRERIALPEGTNAWVQLAQIDDQGRTLFIIAENAFISPTQGSPVPFSLDYDNQHIYSGAKYALRAHLLYQGKTLFATPDPVPVDLPVENPVNLLMRGFMPVDDESATIPEDQEITGQIWELRELYGQQPERLEHQGLPFVTFNPDKQEDPELTPTTRQGRANGSDGCNSFVASYTVLDHELNFGQQASTMMLCLNGMDQARAFSTSLSETNGWRMRNNRLEFLHLDRVVAVFEGVALN